jgi:hypothetical protein
MLRAARSGFVCDTSRVRVVQVALAVLIAALLQPALTSKAEIVRRPIL